MKKIIECFNYAEMLNDIPRLEEIARLHSQPVIMESVMQEFGDCGESPEAMRGMMIAINALIAVVRHFLESNPDAPGLQVGNLIANYGELIAMHPIMLDLVKKEMAGG